MQITDDRARLAPVDSTGFLARVNRARGMLSGLPQGLSAGLAQERDGGTAFNLVPVFFGTGILAYFAAPQEPSALLIGTIASASLVAAFWMQRHGTAFFMVAAFGIVMAGAATAQWRTARIDGPVIPREMTGRITGVVLLAETTRRQGMRYLIRPISIEGLAQADMPRKIRITASSSREMAKPGQVISGIARLQPFSGPLIPGGHDFGFANWFAGLGGTGFFMGKAVAGEDPASLNGWESSAAAINRLRTAMSQRIRSAVGGETGDISAALITGERMAVDKATEESFRRSGLAHILSISGLHMVLVTLTVVWALRFALALVPALAVNWPIRKWASAAGLASATFYLLLSGAEVPTQRSYIMIAIMLAALLADRRAISLRNVALAALGVLILTPEAVLEAGFQMSFAAAAALVATFSAITDWRNRKDESDGKAKQKHTILRAGLTHLGSLALTSLVAGLATGLFAAWHFHRISPLGLVANLAAMPVTSFVTMPLALLGVVLMPFGLEALALVPMGWSIDVVVRISDWIGSFPIDDTIGHQPLSMILFGSMGLVLLVCLRTRLRYLGFLLLAAAFFPVEHEKPPDLIIAQSGRTAAIRGENGELALFGKGRDPFVTEIWARAWKLDEKAATPPDSDTCSRDHCMAVGHDGVRVEIVYAPALIQIACGRADVLAAPRLRYVNCRGRKPAVILSRLDFEARGTHAVLFPRPARDEYAYSVKTSIGMDDRPWSLARHVARQRTPAPTRRFNSAVSALPAGPAPSPGPD